MIQKLERLAKENRVTFTSVVMQCVEYALDNMGADSAEAKLAK